MKRKDYLWILKWFLIWRLFLQFVVYFAVSTINLQDKFLGGQFKNYITNPHFWAWGNYDAEHYLSIARAGYKPLQFFYFPLYPLLINKIVNLFHFEQSIFNYQLAGLVLSHTSFFVMLIGLYKLVAKRNSKSIARLTITLLLFFPTSYYFAAGYTESLFLMLVVWSMYFFDHKKYLYSGLAGALSAATRTTGVLLLPAYLFYLFRRREFRYRQTYILLIPLGLLIYMYYLYQTTGNAFAFNENGYIFGEYRSAKPVLLAQVFYRYIFKVLPAISVSGYFPSIFTTWLEFLTATAISLVLLFGLKNIPSHWWIYMFTGFLSPTLYLNFVSMPRYSIVLFPFFVFLAIGLQNRAYTKLAYLFISCIGLVLALSLFSRGYWVS